MSIEAHKLSYSSTLTTITTSIITHPVLLSTSLYLSLIHTLVPTKSINMNSIKAQALIAAMFAASVSSAPLTDYGYPGSSDGGQCLAFQGAYSSSVNCAAGVKEASTVNGPIYVSGSSVPGGQSMSRLMTDGRFPTNHCSQPLPPLSLTPLPRCGPRASISKPISPRTSASRTPSRMQLQSPIRSLRGLHTTVLMLTVKTGMLSIDFVTFRQRVDLG